MARRRRRPSRDRAVFNPTQGAFAYTKDGQYVRVIEQFRRDGVFYATVRHQDKDMQRLPSGGLAAFRVRDLLENPPEPTQDDPPPTAPSKPTPKPRRPRFVVTNTVNTPLSKRYDFGVHAFGCRDVARERRRYGVDVYNHFERTADEVVKSEREDLASSGFGEEAAEEFHFKVFACCNPQPKPTRRVRTRKITPDAGVSSKPNKPLRSEPKAARLAGASKPKPTLKEDRMARRTAATKEPEPTTTAKRGRRKAAVAVEPEESNGNGVAKPRMTHEQKLRLVPEVVKRLKAGETFTEIRQDPDMPSSGLRKALFDRGYNTKGEKIEGDDDLSELEGKPLAKAVAQMREDGVPWFRCELAADMGQGELMALLEDHGFGHLNERQSKLKAAEVEEEAPAPKTRSRKRAAKAEPEEEAPKPTRKSRGRRRANPSDED